MDLERLARKQPVLYHIAEDGSWKSIQKLGLLSTSGLLDKFEIKGELRFGIESVRRPEMARIEHPEYGAALVRDNKPMLESALERCLVGMTPRECYETLNRRVFFWVDQKRLLRGHFRTWCSALPRSVGTLFGKHANEKYG